MKVEDTVLPGVQLVHPDWHRDGRGWFVELAHEERYRLAGIDHRFVQSNVSWSGRGVLRGMHYQVPFEQGKLVTVLQGSIFDAVVDVRAGSPTFGRWYGCELNTENGLQLWIPPGFAHGFLVLSEQALVHYSCTAAYRPEADRVIAWNDSDVAILWPFLPAQTSPRDAQAPRLRDIPQAALPRHPDAAGEARA